MQQAGVPQDECNHSEKSADAACSDASPPATHEAREDKRLTSVCESLALGSSKNDGYHVHVLD